MGRFWVCEGGDYGEWEVGRWRRVLGWWQGSGCLLAEFVMVLDRFQLFFSLLLGKRSVISRLALIKLLWCGQWMDGSDCLQYPTEMKTKNLLLTILNVEARI